MNTSTFESKEQYLNFKKVWAQSNTDKRCKSVLVRQSHGVVRYPGWITGAHFVLYDILLNRDPSTGFVPITSQSKLSTLYPYSYGYNKALEKLHYVCMWAKRIKEDKNINYPRVSIDSFMEPLQSTISHEMLSSITVPNPIYHSTEYCEELANSIASRTNEPTIVADNLFTIVDRTAT